MKYLLIVPFITFCILSAAQEGGANLGEKAGSSEKQLEWSQLTRSVNVSFAGSDKRYAQELPPSINQTKEWSVTAWKGEKVHTQVLLWSTKDIDAIKMVTSDLKDAKGSKIGKELISTGFVQYVITDEFKGGCGYRQSKDFDSSWVADRIDTSVSSVKMVRNTSQPVWLSIKVPATARAGLYTGKVTVIADRKYDLTIKLRIIDRVLPPPSQWTYHLDLWQHPAAIARVHQVPLWSREHYSVMKKYYTMLADAGQKVITASIVNEPWGHQTYDDYPGLIKWTKKKNGGWSYDYRLFDQYVSFVMECGIQTRINCYSMVPWKVAFSYFDEALQKDTVFTGAIGTPEYNEFWREMLTDFTRHLKEKNWFQITAIAMDERPMASMQAVIQLLKSIDKDWKIALAGDYHPEIEKDIYDYCIASRWKFPADVLKKRNGQSQVSTWYTCCTEEYPNGFTFSPPDEHVWMGWYTAATQMDGYLRWAFNSWTREPLTDSRFTAWPAGDTYQVYPGPHTSIRFEKLIEGIQDHEKIRLLREEYKRTKQTAKLKELEAALSQFEIKKLPEWGASKMVAEAKYLLN